MKRNNTTHTILLLLVTLFGWFTTGTIKAQDNTTDDNKKSFYPTVSILTCSPGEEIYSLFGHTAIRYTDNNKGVDIVFNYGMFSFNTPHFIWRFVKGETDYQLGITPYRYFEAEYFNRGSYVYEQKINLSREQTEALFNALMYNYLPENRVYRYNYFYDNCTSRARKKIEEVFGGKVNYRKEMPETTFRNIVHQYTKGHEWSEFGIDICIGSQADKPIDKYDMMFAPFYYKDFLASATIEGTDSLIAQKEEAIVIPEYTPESPNIPSPMVCFGALFLLTVILTLIEYRRNKTFWFYDIILFGGTGLCGVVIAFLVLFSTHPAVSPNYMLFIMHPFHLLVLPWFIRDEIKYRKSPYHILNAAVLLIFFISYFAIPQQFNSAVLFLALSLLTRSIYYTYKIKKQKNK